MPRTYMPTTGNIVVAKRSDEATMTDAGLFVITSTETKPETMLGDVLAVGPDITDVSPGDVVLAPYFAGSEVESGVIIMPVEVVFGIVTP